MAFTIKEGMVRVDLFKDHGKWYDTVELDMTSFYTTLGIYEAIKTAFSEQYPDSYQTMWAVCLDPYHEYSHPVMWKVL